MITVTFVKYRIKKRIINKKNKDIAGYEAR